jgi:hypothetical protein
MQPGQADTVNAEDRMTPVIETAPEIQLVPQDITDLLGQVGTYHAICTALFQRCEQREKCVHSKLVAGFAVALVLLVACGPVPPTVTPVPPTPTPRPPLSSGGVIAYCYWERSALDRCGGLCRKVVSR